MFEGVSCPRPSVHEGWAVALTVATMLRACALYCRRALVRQVYDRMQAQYAFLSAPFGQ